VRADYIAVSVPQCRLQLKKTRRRSAHDYVRNLRHHDEWVVTWPANIAHDSIETSLERFRDRMADGRSTLSDLTSAQRVRGELADAVQSARQSGYGNKARILRGVLGEVDRALENASEGYLAANQRFAQASRNIEAIQTGRDAAMR
jgi:hypothetical protein